jgi:hypothetical protein
MLDFLPVFNVIAFVAVFAAANFAYELAAKRKWPFFVKVLSGFGGFVLTTAFLFFLYLGIGFPAWMHWLTDLAPNLPKTQIAASAKLTDSADFYTIDSTGWLRNPTPSGDLFTCQVCDEQIQVQIDPGVKLAGDLTNKTNKEFIDALSDDNDKKEFAESIIRGSVPLQSGFTISIDHVETLQTGGLDMFAFNATVNLAANVFQNQTRLAIYRNRLLKITLDYNNSLLNDKSKTAVAKLFESLKISPQ